MEFIETPIFTKEFRKIMSDGHYRLLQRELLMVPEAGKLIIGSGGLRKLRWSMPERGKRGSIRIIYYFQKPDTIFMLFLYKKNDLENLSLSQVKMLKKITEEYLQ
jgi:mRNA-degrading endonuclease RelE of RelBE toxin-antitoxin system